MPLWRSLVQYSNALNILACLSAVIGGIYLYKKYRPAAFDHHRFMDWAFWFLLARWLVLFAQYCVVIGSPESQRLLLAANDLTSVCDMAFAWILVYGDDFIEDRARTIGAFATFCVLLWGWNIALAPHSATVVDLGRRAAWIAPSDAFSAFTLPLVGFVFLLRYRGIASLILFLVTLAYSICQRPITFALLTSESVATGIRSVSGYLLGLAVGKILLGGMVYGLFFAPVTDYSEPTKDLTEEAKGVLKLAVKRTIRTIVLILLVHLPLAFLAAYLLVRLGLAR